MSHQIELVAVPAALRQAHNVTVAYPRLWRAVVDGRVPAIRDGRRWYIEQDKLPEIARIMSPATA